jgi:hypothetical protein
MAELFLDPKVLNYSADKYELILMTLRWARAMKSKVTIAEIMANKIVAEPVVDDIPAVVSVAGEGKAELAPDTDEDEGKKTKKKKKKE